MPLSRDQFEGSLPRSQRRENAIRRTARRNGETRGHQGVFDLKAADQRQLESMTLTGMLDADGLGESVDRGIDRRVNAANNVNRRNLPVAIDSRGRGSPDQTHGTAAVPR